MSFFERARVGYENLAGRADEAFDSATERRELGDIDQYFRDLGVLAYLSATGRAADSAAQQRILHALTALEERGAIRDLVLQTEGGAPAGSVEAPQRHGGSDGIPQPPPERAGRHGDFLTQPRQPGVEQVPGAASDPDEDTGPRPSHRTPPPPPMSGGTWGPPQR